MRYEYRPLPAVWPFGVRTDEPGRSPFKAVYSDTLALLDRELWCLEAVEPIVFEAGYRAYDIRRDGLPRANAQLVDQAVILSFDSKHGPLRYGCERFADHKANLRAIALGLEALRKVDRYGITRRGEQYRGFEALPAAGEGGMTTTEAVSFIHNHAGGISRDQDLRTAYIAAAKKLNMQLPGADRALWDQLQRAKVALDL